MATRESLLEALSHVKFCAVPTVYTMDMGLEYDYISSEGANTCLGRIGEWPAYKLGRISDDQWKEIVQKLHNHELSEADFKGTDIGLIIQRLHEVYGDMYDDYYQDTIETFADLSGLPASLPEEFFCLIDVRAWGEKPKFFVDYDEFMEAFREEYCYDVIPWDEYDDQDLAWWLSRAEDDLSEFPLNTFEDDD